MLLWQLLVIVSRTSVAQIQLRIMARRCAANLVMLVKLFGQQKLPKESKEFFSQELSQ